MPLIAADTNTILTPTPRRLVTSILDREDGKVAVTPTVRREMTWNIIENAQRAITRWMRRVPPSGEDQAEVARTLAGVAAKDWWDQQATANDSPFAFLDTGNEEKSQYEYEFARLPGEAFMDRNDRLIAAEAIVHGLPLLVTFNFNTIEPGDIERLADRGLCGRISIVNLVGLVEYFNGRRHQTVARYALESICGACISDRQRPIEDDLYSIRSFTGNLSRGERGRNIRRRGSVAPLVETELEDTSRDSLRSLVNETRRNPPWRARSSERKYHQMQRDAVRSTGYDPWESSPDT